MQGDAAAVFASKYISTPSVFCVLSHIPCRDQMASKMRDFEAVLSTQLLSAFSSPGKPPARTASPAKPAATSAAASTSAGASKQLTVAEPAPHEQPLQLRTDAASVALCCAIEAFATHLEQRAAHVERLTQLQQQPKQSTEQKASDFKTPSIEPSRIFESELKNQLSSFL